jgi:hypothetical protein
LRTATIGPGELLATPAGGIQVVAQLSGDPDSLLTAGNGTLDLGTKPADLLVFALAPLAGPAASPIAQAVGGTAGTPVSIASPDVLLTTTFPAALLPKGPASVEFWTWSWEPGDHYFAEAYHPTVSVGGDLVLSGTYGTRSDGDIIAWRDGRYQTVPLDHEVVLNTGDGVIYLDNAANEWFRNAGDTTNELASFAITLGDDFQGPNLGVDWEKSGLSGHDVTVTIDRQTLAPGQTLPPTSPNLTAPTVRIVEDGELTWEAIRSGDQEAAPPVRFPKGATVPFVVPADGGQVELSNTGDAPLVFLTLTLTSAGDAAGTPVS